MIKIIPEQIEFSPALPVVIGNTDYQEFERRLIRIDEILKISGIEGSFIKKQLGKYFFQKGKGQKSIQPMLRRALRCNLARWFTEKEYRVFSTRLADSRLLQWFCGIDRIEKIEVPSKSTLERYDKLATAEEMREIIDELNRFSMDPENYLNLQEKLNLEAYFSDTTCVKANIHFPVDWVLLRDGIRTLIKAMKVMRKHGLRHRMPSPEMFLGEINRLSIQMSQSRRQWDAKKCRKRTLRKMKQIAKRVTEHAKRYLEILEKKWKESDLQEGEKNEIAKRMRNIVEQMPEAIQQAHERIIGERKVLNQDKILSLYEKNIHVIVRGKANAEVEFGNTLFIAEQNKGLIVDWKLEKEKTAGDPKLLQESIERQKNIFGQYPGSVGADRGFSFKTMKDYLNERKIYNAICPKSPKLLKEQIQKVKFRKLQKRRAQTEARIGIIKNNFLGGLLRNKGFKSRETAVGWAIFAHNLWLLSGLPEAEEKIRKKAA